MIDYDGSPVSLKTKAQQSANLFRDVLGVPSQAHGSSRAWEYNLLQSTDIQNATRTNLATIALV